MAQEQQPEQIWGSIRDAERYASDNELPALPARAATRAIIKFANNQYLPPTIGVRHAGHGIEFDLRAAVAYLDDHGPDGITGIGDKSTDFLRQWLKQRDESQKQG